LKIPILNIYYLLCYAWDKLDEGQKVNVSASEYDESINLFSRVLVNGCRHLFKRGLDRTYKERTHEYVGIKGRIDFKESLNKNLFKQGRSICRFDQFEADILPNQLLKATLLRLTKVSKLDNDLKQEVWDCYWRLHEVSDIILQLALFSRVRIHRNNSFYDFLIRVCRLVVENTVLDEKDGTYQFKEFIGSDKAMASLFETFVRNFYKKEQEIFSVRREDINWDAKPLESSSYSYLPKMQTDITLESNNRKIIIETKYYVNALTSRFEAEKFNTGNLYQLYAYLRNIEAKEDHPLNPYCEGILLYPTVNYTLDEKFKMGTHLVKVRTVDLNKKWQEIEENLLNIIA
jgi:5-methylcytosine-specific restriction enzyme subunit McrC